MDKSKYYKFNDIVSLIKLGLDNAIYHINGYEENGWQVVRSNQPTIQALQDKTIYFDIISKRRIGVQGTRPVKTEDGNWANESVWYEELLVQVSAFKRRNPGIDDILTQTSSDIIDLLQAVINADGDLPEGNTDESSKFIRDENFQVIRSTNIRELDYETDSGLKEKMPQFDFLVVVKQRLLKNINKIDTIELETKRI